MEFLFLPQSGTTVAGLHLRALKSDAEPLLGAKGVSGVCGF